MRYRFPRKVSCILAAVFLSANLYSLTLHEVRQTLANAPASDTIDVRMHITVQSMGFSSAITGHIIAKGPDKLWMEQTLPTGNQRIVRNGQQVQITDLKTGERQTPEIPPELPALNQSGQYAGLLETGAYRQPVIVSGTIFRIDLVPGSDSSAASRSITYDAALEEVTGIMEAGHGGDTTWTDITYCRSCGFKVPVRLVIRTKMEGSETRITMDYYDALKPSTIPETLFKIF